METPLSPSVLPETSLCSANYQVSEHTEFSGTSEELGKSALSDWLFSSGYAEEAWKLAECGLKFGHYICGKGHEFYYRQYCGREYCPTCGAKNSYYHNRRVMRASEHFIWAITWGNLTFTMPKEISESHLDKSQLRKLQDLSWQVAQRILKVEGAEVVVHLLGRENKGLHVHFEVLFHRLGCFNRGMISKPKLKAIKKVWALLLNKEFKLNLATTDVKYSFAASRNRKIHKLNYIHRAVCTEEAMLGLSDEDRVYILNLKGYHRQRWYGVLSNKNIHEFLRKHWAPIEIKEIPPLERKVCPIDKTKMRHIGWCFESDINKNNFVAHNDRIYIDRVMRLELQALHNKEGP